MNENEILKQKIEYAQRWDDMLNGLKHVENEARGKRCCYCNIYRSGLNSTCSDCPLFPKLCNLKKGTPSTYTHIWDLMEALREECFRLKDGIQQDIEHTKKTLKEEPPKDTKTR